MARFVPIKEIIDGHFVVPDFQRDYAWERENFELMLDDIREACEHKKPRYVLGQLVVADTEETQGKVVDGQQRLTSLAIILKALGEGDCGFLDFENRERTRKILDALSNPQNNDEIDNLAEAHSICGKIRDMYLLALDYFAANFKQNGESDDRISKEDFCNYLKTRVFFVEKRLDEGERIQHAFEVLNTTGEPLKREDIAKAKLISDMVSLGREKEAELFNYAWKLCCDLERGLDGRVAERIADIHAAASLEGLHDAMKDLVQKDEESGLVSLANIVDAVKGGKVFRRGDSSGQGGGYPTGDFVALLAPYRFLDTALKAGLDKFKNPISDISKITSDSDRAIATPDDALNVIKALLLYRTAYDRLVVRRKKGGWNWELNSPIAAGEGEENKRRQLILIESMMAVSGVEATRKLINAAKAAQDNALSEGKEPSPDEIINDLEEYVKGIVKKEMGKLDNGVWTSRFAFRWLDYLLALNPEAEIVAGIKDKAERFSFVDASSVEHLLPRHPLDGHAYSPEENEMLDTFGNLALISRSKNSKQSNLPPEQKAKQEHGLESLKYELMLQIAEQEGWSPAACKEHGEAMKGILADSLQRTVGNV